jgi:SAM-dependent methyltransferase
MTEAGGQPLDFAAPRRNGDAILEVLRPLFGATPRHVLEVASGSGQHAVHMTAACPGITWWPTDLDPDHLSSIDAWRRQTGLASIRPATLLDVTGAAWRRGESQAGWPPRFDAVVNTNMIHIAPWAAAEGLIEGAGRCLADNGFLYLYGPFKRNGEHTAPSNRAFDDMLRAQNPDWGVRDIAAVEAVATGFGLKLARTVEMPANNLSLVFRINRP